MSKRTSTSDVIDDFLYFVATGATFSLAILAPNSIQALEKPLAKFVGDGKNRKETKRIGRYLKQQKLISVRDCGDGNFEVVLSGKGKERANKLRFDRLEIPDEKWDEKWRVFMFDIPEQHKSTRDFVGYHIKRIGFIQLQRSVFVYPYPIDDFVAVLIEVHPELEKYIVVLTASELSNHNQLVKAFSSIL